MMAVHCSSTAIWQNNYTNSSRVDTAQRITLTDPLKFSKLSNIQDRIWSKETIAETYANSFNILLLHMLHLENTQVFELKTTSTLIIDEKANKVVDSYLHLEAKVNNIDILIFDNIVKKVKQYCPFKKVFNVKTKLNYSLIEPVV